MIPDRVQLAIREACQMHGQPPVVADRIITFMENLVSSNVDEGDLQALIEVVQLESE